MGIRTLSIVQNRHLSLTLFLVLTVQESGITQLKKKNAYNVLRVQYTALKCTHALEQNSILT